MIIRHLHIDHFGKFKDYDIDFEPGFNVVYGQNEDGKSTLMGFIMMMFYGNSYSGKDITQNLRKRFRPWDGSPMKGMMRLEVDRIQYQLTRTFHASNSTDDIQLRHAVTNDILKLGKTPGETLFDLNQSEFEKSVFVSQGGCIIGNTHNEGINERLTNMASSGDEDVSPDKIHARLEKARTDLVSKRGDKGRLVNIQGRLNRLHEARGKAEEEEKEKIDRQDHLAKLAQHRGQRLEFLKVIQEDKLTCQNRIHQAELARAIERETERLLLHRTLAQGESQLLTQDGLMIDAAYIEEAECKVQDIRGHLKDKRDCECQIAALRTEAEDLKAEDREPLSQEKLDAIKEKTRQLQTSQASLDKLQGDTEDLQAYLDAKDQLNRFRKKGQDLSQAHVSLEARVNGIKTRINEAKETHAGLVKEENRIGNLLDNLEQDKQKQAERIDQLASLQKEEAPGIKKGRPKVAISIALIIISTLVCSFLYFAVGGWAWAGLLIPLALAASLIIRHRTSSHQAKTQNTHYQELLNKEKAYLASMIEDLEKSKASLAKATQAREESERALKILEAQEVEPSQSLLDLDQAIVKNDVSTNMCSDRLRKLETGLKDRKLEASQDTLEELAYSHQAISAEMAALRDALDEETKPYGSANIEDLIDRYHADKHHQENKDRVEGALDQKLTLKGEIEGNLNALWGDLQVQLARVGQVASLEDALVSIDRLKKQVDQVKTLRIQVDNADKHRQKLESDFNLEALEARKRNLAVALSDKEEVNVTGPDLEDKLKQLSDQEEEVKNELASIDQEMASLEAEFKEKYRNKLNVSQLNEQIKHLEAIEERMSQNYQALDIAMTTLGESFSELQQDFGPRLNRLTAQNLSQLTHQKYNQVKIAKDLDIAVGTGEKDRVFSWQHLSEGTIDQAYLALRMAIIELVIPREKALPLLLDDIFAQYDDERAAWGLAFLKEKTRVDYPVQTLLFTCHDRIVREAEKLGGIHRLTL